jgi:hypothetical protein
MCKLLANIYSINVNLNKLQLNKKEEEEEEKKTMKMVELQFLRADRANVLCLPYPFLYLQVIL